jgi:hypothetical protein
MTTPSHPRTALASFPRSGNTWIRFLLEQAVGQLCGSIYKDRIMPRSKEGIAIKTHALDSKDYDRALHVLRNPFDVIDSYYHWKIGVAEQKNVDWDEHVRATAKEWRAHTEHWLKARCDSHRVRYEDLKARPAEELEKIVRWLGYDVAPAQIAAAVEAAHIEKMRERNGELGQKFFRRGEVGKSYTAFTPEQLAYVRSELGPYLQQFGYADAPVKNA